MSEHPDKRTPTQPTYTDLYVQLTGMDGNP